MALALQLQGVGRQDWQRWIGRLPPFAELSAATIQEILDHLVQHGILYSDGIRLSLGDQAQAEYGRRNFLELLSVFTTPPLLAVFCGPKQLGSVDQVAVSRQKPEDPVVLSLGGRSWAVQDIDWRARQVFVRPETAAGRTTWLGVRRGVSYAIARAVHRLLTSGDAPEAWSRRAQTQMSALRDQYAFLRPDADIILSNPDRREQTWFTFAGSAVNLALQQALERAGLPAHHSDDAAVWLGDVSPAEAAEQAIGALHEAAVGAGFQPPPQLAEALKFHDCLPPPLVEDMLRSRFIDRRHVAEVLQRLRVRVTLRV
jgi:ATP-dependent Lhr-like helicase